MVGLLSVEIHESHQFIGKSILNAQQHQNWPLKCMKMVWVVRGMNTLCYIPPLGLELMGHSSNGNRNAQLDINCTRTSKILEQQVRDREVGPAQRSEPRTPYHDLWSTYGRWFFVLLCQIRITSWYRSDISTCPTNVMRQVQAAYQTTASLPGRVTITTTRLVFILICIQNLLNYKIVSI